MYQGYYNYQTFAVITWITNEERTYHDFREKALEIVSHPHSTKWGDVRKMREFAMRELYYTQEMTGLNADLLANAYSDVAWIEVLEAFTEK